MIFTQLHSLWCGKIRDDVRINIWEGSRNGMIRVGKFRVKKGLVWRMKIRIGKRA